MHFEQTTMLRTRMNTHGRHAKSQKTNKQSFSVLFYLVMPLLLL